VDDACVAVTMLGLLSAFDCFFEVRAADEWDEGHHLFCLNEWVIETCFAEEKFDGRIDATSCGFREFDRVLTEQFFAWSEVFVGTFADDLHCSTGKAIDFGALQTDGAGSAHRIHHGIENAIDNEDFFFCDTQKVVVVRCALDDTSGGEIKVSGFIDDDRRVSGTGDNSTFSAVESSASDGGSAGHADQSDLAMLEELLRGIESWFTDQADDVVDADFCANRFVESSHTFGSDFAAAWVWIHYESVPAGDHADGVAGDGGQGVGHGGDCTDDTEGCMFDYSEAAVAAVAFGFEEFDAWSFLAECFEFLDFVNETSDFGFFHFHGAEFDTLADGDTSDDIDDLLSIFDGSLLKLFESAAGCGDSLVDVIEEA
jgi:hypothetical protein